MINSNQARPLRASHVIAEVTRSQRVLALFLSFVFLLSNTRQGSCHVCSGPNNYVGGVCLILWIGLTIVAAPGYSQCPARKATLDARRWQCTHHTQNANTQSALSRKVLTPMLLAITLSTSRTRKLSKKAPFRVEFGASRQSSLCEV